MRILRILARLVLLCLIVFGSCRVLQEQQFARICQQESAELERKLNALLEISSQEVSVKQIQSEKAVSSWIVSVPPGRSIDFVLVERNSTETTLANIPARRDSQRGIVQIEFLGEGATNSAFRQFTIYALDFNQVTHRASEKNQFTKPRFWTETISKWENGFEELASLSRLRESNRFYTSRNETTEIPKQCRLDESLMLCSFSEVERPGEKLQYREFMLKISVK